MKVLVAGGGSGGHVTPALAILEALAKHEADLQICFVCDKKFAPQAQTILAASKLPITLQTVAAGKFRRYHGVPLWRQLLDLPTVFLNVRDLFVTGWGVLQSWRLLRRFEPDVVFGKGGFVCMPVGIAAHFLKLPLVLHDSDAHPGLTNRVLAPWATAIATGAPLANYNYDRAKSRFVGIPVGSAFRPASAAEQQVLRQQVMHEPSRVLLVVVGGGLGAQPINEALVLSATELLRQDIEIIHVTGAAHGPAVESALAQHVPNTSLRRLYHIEPFVDTPRMAAILKAADIVVSRGGATAMAELAALGKAVILVPNPRLTGGQQLKNAQGLVAAQAVVQISDQDLQSDYTILQQYILQLRTDAAGRRKLGAKISSFAKPQAAEEVARLIKRAGAEQAAKRRHESEVRQAPISKNRGGA